MPSLKVQKKLTPRGRKAAFARYAEVSLSHVSKWLAGKSDSARLNRLARQWHPQNSDGHAAA